MKYLAINRCPIHGFLSVSVDDESTGVRITPGKCCGRWEIIKQWPISQVDVEEIDIAKQEAEDDRENGE